MTGPASFDAPSTAKRLLREARVGALSTLAEGSGDPYASLVAVATAADGSPLLLLSDLALHTKNLRKDARAALLLSEADAGDPLQAERLTVMGEVTRESDDSAAQRYLMRHPDAEGFARFRDFAFYRLHPRHAHLVAGFGRIAPLSPDAFLTACDDAGELTAAEAGICAHMNEDHTDALSLYATVLLGEKPGPWLCVGCDPEGLELQNGRRVRRLAFDQRVTSLGVLRGTLKQLAERARAALP